MKTFYLLIAVWALGVTGCSQHQERSSARPEPLPSLPEKSTPDRSGRLRTRTMSNLPESGKRGVVTQPTEAMNTAPVHYSMPGRRVSHVSVPGKYVALTFDDGPSASLTPKILDILKRHQARGTFFVLGENVARNKAIVARAAAEGHEIASHSWNHPNLSRIGMEQVRSQVERTNDVIEAASGRRPSLLRPPYGATNKGIIDALYHEYGLTSVLWDVDTRDWSHPGVDVVINRAVGQAKSGSIILVHDIHASTLAAIEGIVTGLQGRGFRLVTVSELIALGRRAAGSTQTGSPVDPTPLPSSPVGASASEKAELAPIPVPVELSAERPKAQGEASVGKVIPTEVRNDWLRPASGGASISGTSAVEGE